MYAFAILVLLFFSMSCRDKQPSQVPSKKTDKNFTVRVYSKSVGDSFSISVNLPNEYSTTAKHHYPVVFLLDANLYFDIASATLNKYSEVGLLPAIILVGIGYKDFFEMDSLRSRDNTYPTAIPEYEMSVSGGADRFLEYINKELVHYIDSLFKTDTTNRTLIGHSLSGYFTAYAFVENCLSKRNTFNHYISASPSLHYNKYYLLKQMGLLSEQNTSKNVTVYFTFGGLEDDEDEDGEEMLKVGQLSKNLSEALQTTRITYKTDIFSNLGHMDTPIPTLIKGLQWSLNGEMESR